jgi:transposase
VNAILYVLWTGCPWRALPDCYPHWRTVHHHFARWAADGTLGRLHDVLRGRVRAAAGRTVAPTAAVIDSQSVRASDWVSRATKGYDAAKKVHGRKRHVAVDTCGLLLEILVTPPACKTATVAGGCCGAFATTCRPSGWSGLMPATPASWSPGPSRSSRWPCRSSASAWASTTSRCCLAAGSWSVPSPGSASAAGWLSTTNESPNTTRLGAVGHGPPDGHAPDPTGTAAGHPSLSQAA